MQLPFNEFVDCGFTQEYSRDIIRRYKINEEVISSQRVNSIIAQERVRLQLAENDDFPLELLGEENV